jgi:hypothetical protein
MISLRDIDAKRVKRSFIQIVLWVVAFIMLIGFIVGYAIAKM